MTIREQLAKQVATPSETATVTYALNAAGVRFRAWEILLECRLPVPPVGLLKEMLGRVNASETCGAAAGHLLMKGCSVERCVTGGTLSRVVVGLMYSKKRWNPTIVGFYPPAEFDPATGVLYPPAEFDALLASLEAGAAPPETWRDREPLL